MPWKQPQADALSPTWVRDPAIGDDLHQQIPKDQTSDLMGKEPVLMASELST